MLTLAPSPPSVCNSSKSILSLEAALASRIIRMGKLPRPLLLWLANSDQAMQGEAVPANAVITAALNKIVLPLLAEAPQWERKEAHQATAWIGAICCTAKEQADRLQLGIGLRLLAASLLPLYRSLATGQLSEGLNESRLRLSELFTLLALCHEIGHDLVRLLDPLNRRSEAPNKILALHFKLDLVAVARVVREQLTGFDPYTMRFNEQSAEALLRFDPSQAGSKLPEWAAPELLWKLSGELISNHTELVLPRAWIETAVPWHSITEHWQQLSQQLSQQVCQVNKSAAAGGDKRSSEGERSWQGTESSTLPRSVVSNETEPVATAFDDLKDHRDNTFHTAATVAVSPPSSDAASTSLGPRVLIAEIRSHNDPVFVNVMRRQIVKCRSEERAVSLVSIVVLPEDGHESHAIHENGLTLWQQRLVNWLAEHPQIVEPHAFLTAEGQLLLCLLDLERNETTSVIRHGLVEVLTGRQHDDSRGDLLARVNVPARYHAGIAASSAPGIHLTAEELIAPAIRCLSAASLQGKASIKSIEVF